MSQENHIETITRTALAWSRHAKASGARFQVERKAGSSLRFSIKNRCSDFVIPSKLVGVKEHRATLRQIADATRDGWQELQLDYDDEAGAVAAYWHGAKVGQIQSKHTKWLLGLVDHISCFVLEITGQEAEGYATLGCNIVFTSIGSALAARADAPVRLGSPVGGSLGRNLNRATK